MKTYFDEKSIEVIEKIINIFYREYNKFDVNKDDMRSYAYLIACDLINKCKYPDKFNNYLFKSLFIHFKARKDKIAFNSKKDKGIKLVSYDVDFYGNEPICDESHISIDRKIDFEKKISKLSSTAKEMVAYLLSEDSDAKRCKIKYMKEYMKKEYSVGKNNFNNAIDEIRNLLKEIDNEYS